MFYIDGRDIFPININDLTFNDSKLIMPFNIACGKIIKEEILAKMQEEIIRDH